MKKIFIMLVIAISAIATTNAQSSNKQTNKPLNVIKQLNFVIDTYGLKDTQSYSIKKNPNTNLIESSMKIARFSFKKTNINQQLNLIREAFTKDEPVSYQFKHITPNIFGVFSVNILPGNDAYVLRSEENEEMWYMCCKNPENPQLRDIYAIVWVESDSTGMIEGHIHMSSSLRPDIYESNAPARKTFKIEGRVDAEIKDSLYNIYIADSYDALERVCDDDYVACVPVINKRFEYSVELDRPKVGRLRCIFPDGSLCSAWIDLDMVPGETYHITVHNGYYDEDRDYENRVGRFSGKSLIAKYASTATTVNNRNQADNIVEDNWNQTVKVSEPTPEQMAILTPKAEILQGNIELIKELYENIGGQMKQGVIMNRKTAKWDNVDMYFNQIYKQNDLLYKRTEDFLETANTCGIPLNAKIEIYKEILQIYTNQNNAFNELYTKFGYISKAGQKCQNQVRKYTEKYMNKMTNLLNNEKGE